MRSYLVDHGDGTRGERDADAEHQDDDVRFRVVAVLGCLVPAIERLRHRDAEADGDDRDDAQPSSH